MATKVTFTLDEETVRLLQRTAQRLEEPKSQVVREAIRDFSERTGRRSERERLLLLKAFDDLVPRIPERPLKEVQKELDAIRKARRGGGRRSARAR